MFLVLYFLILQYKKDRKFNHNKIQKKKKIILLLVDIDPTKTLIDKIIIITFS